MVIIPSRVECICDRTERIYNIDGAPRRSFFVKLSTGISQSKWSATPLMFVTGFRIRVSSSDSILLSQRRRNLSIPNCSTSNQLFSPPPQKQHDENQFPRTVSLVHASRVTLDPSNTHSFTKSWQSQPLLPKKLRRQ